MRALPCVQKDEGSVRVMCSNDSSTWYMNLCRKYPDNLGWLIGPRFWKNPREGVAFALDNDAYQSFSNGTPYDFKSWSKFLHKVKASGIVPLWALVPDVVANRSATLEQWGMFNREVAESYGWKTALAVQDGMTREDVLGLRFQPDVIFVGGTTVWKWKTAHVWCRDFPRVHVGRVNGKRRLWHCQRIGAESCDGSGWTRGTTCGREARQLEVWLENQEPHPELAL